MNLAFGAVILAAGMARRMGQQKLLLPLNNKPILAYVLSIVHDLSWQASLAVIGQPESELAELCRQYHIRSAFNANRQSGQASSITLALQNLPSNLAGILFLLGDQPLVTHTLIDAMLAKFRQAACNKSIIVPCYQGQRYSPVLIGGHWRSCLAEITGDMGGRQIIQSNPAWVIDLEWPEPTPFYDADTWEEYLRLQELLEKHPDNRGNQMGNNVKY